MTLATVPALALTLLFILPGAVYQIVSARLRGPSPEDTDQSSRLLRALAASTVLVGIYVVTVGPQVVRATRGTPGNQYAGVEKHARSIGLLGLALLVGVPAVIAWSECRMARRGKNHARYDPTPTAWQWGTRRAFSRPGYVRVLTEAGTWVGGYFADASHATGYPEPPSLFIERGHYMSEDGTIGAAKVASRGTWVRCDTAVAVDFLDGVTGEPPSSLEGRGR